MCVCVEPFLFFTALVCAPWLVLRCSFMAALASLILTACGVSESSDAARTNYSAHTQPTSPPTVATMSSSLAKPQERNINITSWCTPLALNELECGESADGVQVVGRRLNRPPWAALNNSVSNVFDWIYKTQYWGSDGGGSGTGSSIQVAAGARRVIEHLVYRLKIRSMIDAPCGAMTWQAPMLQELKRRDPAFRYFGVDIVDSVVQRNAQQLSHLANVSFATMNLETDALPRGYDLILSRDAMQHNSFDTIKSMLQTFVATDARSGPCTALARCV